MKIRQLRIIGFKSLRNFELSDIPDFVVFVGANGVGKTAIFQAVGLLKDWVESYTNSRNNNES